MSQTTSEEIKRTVQRFEDCDFAADEFHHSDHLTVALCYLLESTEVEASARMRAGLLRFLNHHGLRDAYHETITVFWIRVVRRLLDKADNTLSLAELANVILSQCNNTARIDAYFSSELLSSEEARMAWVEPDLRPLES